MKAHFTRREQTLSLPGLRNQHLPRVREPSLPLKDFDVTGPHYPLVLVILKLSTRKIREIRRCIWSGRPVARVTSHLRLCTPLSRTGVLLTSLDTLVCDATDQPGHYVTLGYLSRQGQISYRTFGCYSEPDISRKGGFRESEWYVATGLCLGLGS